ncbi:MAG: hypothetical protein Q4E10_04315, partial [Porphyromonas sp.]|nr:hypothetical protein [Porphyromonas sp.]
EVINTDRLTPIGIDDLGLNKFDPSRVADVPTFTPYNDPMGVATFPTPYIYVTSRIDPKSVIRRTTP